MKSYDDVYKTPGAVSWSELTTSDPAAAVAFYAALFGWKTEAMALGGGDYHVVKVGDTAIGGIMGTPPGAPPMPPHWGAYVTVAAIDATLEKATGLGAKVLMPPMQVPGVGRMAVLQDPQGAVINVMQYDAPSS